MINNSPHDIKNDAPLKILIVEDDLVFTVFYESFLSKKGASIHNCFTLSDAERLIDSNTLQFDAILLDNQLDDGEGISLLPHLKSKQSIAAVIMVSGNDSPNSFLTAFNAGIHDYMVKPVNLDLLWLKITKSVEQQRLKRLSLLQHRDLSYWIGQEQEQQNLAKHLFDRMFHGLNQPSPAVHEWVKSHSIFSGDAIIHCIAEDGSWYFLLADAMGHGLAPAISLMPLLSGFYAMAQKAIPLTNMVHELNDKLNSLLPDDRFIAAVVVRFDPCVSTLEIWNGGMPAVQILDKNGLLISSASSKNMALGVLDKDQVDVKSDCYSLDESDFSYFMMFSDGLTETVLENNEQLQPDHLPSLIQWNDDKPFRFIKSQFKNVPEQDDVSICLVNCRDIMTEHFNNTAEGTYSPGRFDINFVLRGNSLTESNICELAINFLKSQNFPIVLVQQVFIVLTELYLNALEHGVLRLDSKIKMQPNGFLEYYNEKQQRLSKLNDEHFIELNMSYSPNTDQIIISMQDSGNGFTPHSRNELTDSALHGRGLILIEKLTDNFEVIPPGNTLKLSMSTVQKNQKTSCKEVS